MDDYDGNGTVHDRVSWEEPYDTIAGLRKELERANRSSALNQPRIKKYANGECTVWVVHNLD